MPATPKRRRILMLMDWYSSAVHEGIAEYASRHGWMLNSHMAQWKTLPAGWKGDGVIASLNVGSEHLRYARKLGLPTVDLGYHYPQFFPACVAADNPRVGALMARHFLERGHRNFAFMFFQNSFVEQDMFTGFRGELSDAGHEPLDLHWTQEPQEVRVDYAKTMAWAKRHLVSMPKPYAIACASDILAGMIIDACVEAGIRVPEEIMVMGAGNDRLICDFAPVTLTSVDVRLQEVGRRAAKLLDSLMSGAPAPDVLLRVPPGRIVGRKSTDFRAVFDPLVRDALSFVWRNYHRKISIDQVAASVNVSRSTLYHAFEAELGATIAQTITKVRMEKACGLLRDSDLPVGEVAVRCGFSGPIVFHNAFQREIGAGPREWRAKNSPARHTEERI